MLHYGEVTPAGLYTACGNVGIIATDTEGVDCPRLPRTRGDRPEALQMLTGLPTAPPHTRG